MRKNLEKKFGTLFLAQPRIEACAFVLDVLISNDTIVVPGADCAGEHIDIFQQHGCTLPFVNIIQLVDSARDKQDACDFHAQIGVVGHNLWKIVPNQARKRSEGRLREPFIRCAKNNNLEVINGISCLGKAIIAFPSILHQSIHKSLEGRNIRDRFLLLRMEVMPKRLLTVGKGR